MSSQYVRWDDKRAKWDEFWRLLGRRIDGASIEIGFPEASGGSAVYSNGRSVAEVAAINEFGSRDGHTPARAFLRNALDGRDNFRPEIREAIRSMGHGALPSEALAYVGEEAVRAVRESIVQFSTPKNADATVAKKGFNDPLIENRMLEGAVSYHVRRRK